MTKNKFPKGWDEARVRRLLEHYGAQPDDEAIAEDEAAFEDQSQATIVVPKELVPQIDELISRHTRS